MARHCLLPWLLRIFHYFSPSCWYRGKKAHHPGRTRTPGDHNNICSIWTQPHPLVLLLISTGDLRPYGFLDSEHPLHWALWSIHSQLHDNGNSNTRWFDWSVASLFILLPSRLEISLLWQSSCCYPLFHSVLLLYPWISSVFPVPSQVPLSPTVLLYNSKVE